MLNWMKMKLLCTTVPAVLLLPTLAHGMTVDCRRTSASPTGFASLQAMESWYPKSVSFNAADFRSHPDKTKKQMIYEHRSVMKGEAAGAGTVLLIWRLLPNGKMLATFPRKSGYSTPPAGRYRCSVNAEDVRQYLRSNGSETANPSGSQKTAPQSTEAGTRRSEVDEAIAKCTSLGFTKGTEKHGDCVMKLLD